MRKGGYLPSGKFEKLSRKKNSIAEVSLNGLRASDLGRSGLGSLFTLPWKKNPAGAHVCGGKGSRIH